MKNRMRLLIGLIAVTFSLAINCSANSDKISESETDGNNRPDPVYPHPQFRISLEDLMEKMQSEPQSVRENILARPQYFLELSRQFLQLPEWARVLVDKQHPLPDGYAPEDLVKLDTYPLTLNRSNLQLSRSCMPAVLAMTEAARIDDVELVYSSTFRSYEYQKNLYEGYVESHGREEADRFSARPGTSQHQLGTTIDFGSITPEFEDTPAGRWLYNNAWKYGFSLSYPVGKEDLTGYMFEIWHYRYITPTGTRLEREFFNGLQQHMLEFYNRHHRFLRESLKAQD